MIDGKGFRLNNSDLKTKIISFLAEDIGNIGDITSSFLIPQDEVSDFSVINKSKSRNTIFCGVDIVKCIADISDIDISFNVKDGDLLNPNDICFYGTGLTSQILRIERVMLNLIQHLSGVATQVSCFVKTLNDDRIKILDTRKTIPGLRDLQKYAVRVGGGVNHRFTLSDMILIKDNHIQVCGGIVSAIEKALVAKQRHLIKIEVECDSVQLVRDICVCLDAIDVVMLDNMSIPDIELCSAILRSVKKNILIEVSGGVTLENIALYKGLDIDYISSGAITHSVSAVDISLDITGIEAE